MFVKIVERDPVALATHLSEENVEVSTLILVKLDKELPLFFIQNRIFLSGTVIFKTAVIGKIQIVPGHYSQASCGFFWNTSNSCKMILCTIVLFIYYEASSIFPLV